MDLFLKPTENELERLEADGTVTTIVGIPGQGSFVPGDLPGVLSRPRAVAIGGTSLYITLEGGVAVVQSLLAAP